MQSQKRNTAQPYTIFFPPGLIATVKAVNKLKPWQTNKAVKPDIDSGYGDPLIKAGPERRAAEVGFEEEGPQIVRGRAASLGHREQRG